MTVNIYFDDLKVGDEMPKWARQTDFMHWNRYAAVNDEFVPFPTPEVLGDLDPEERLGAYLRYDFYCMIQEWIVRNIMEAS